jgi:hypothetical protein
MKRPAAIAAALLLGCTLVVVLSAGASRASAQVASKRSVCLTVTDSEGRFVTGLERGHFEVSENGARREISGFLDADSPVTIAIVGEEPLAAPFDLGPGGELIQTASLADALRRLAASSNPRQGIVTAAGTDTQAIPPGIAAVQADAADMARAVLALRLQYCLEVAPSTPSAGVDVVVHRLRGLPALNLNWLNGQ